MRDDVLFSFVYKSSPYFLQGHTDVGTHSYYEHTHTNASPKGEQLAELSEKLFPIETRFCICDDNGRSVFWFLIIYFASNEDVLITLTSNAQRTYRQHCVKQIRSPSRIKVHSIQYVSWLRHTCMYVPVQCMHVFCGLLQLAMNLEKPSFQFHLVETANCFVCLDHPQISSADTRHIAKAFQTLKYPNRTPYRHYTAIRARSCTNDTQYNYHSVIFIHTCRTAYLTAGMWNANGITHWIAHSAYQQDRIFRKNECKFIFIFMASPNFWNQNADNNVMFNPFATSARYSGQTFFFVFTSSCRQI